MGIMGSRSLPYIAASRTWRYPRIWEICSSGLFLGGSEKAGMWKVQYVLLYLQRQGFLSLVYVGRMHIYGRQHQNRSRILCPTDDRNPCSYQDWNYETPWSSSYISSMQNIVVQALDGPDSLFGRFFSSYFVFFLWEVISTGLLTTRSTAVTLSSSTSTHCRIVT